jgi:molybdopterin-binding protein
MALEIRNLSVTVGTFRVAVESLDVAAGEVFVLLGRSGSGKTVLLETLAGFHAADGGAVRLDGRDLLGLPTQKRGVAVIFQDFSLFPHLSVRENILFGARHAGVPPDESARRAAELIKMLDIAGLLDRDPTKLSGGQKQRVALARALMLRPGLLVFDEPLSSLDAAMRERLREELRTLLTGLRQTTVYVTHDRTEAFAIGDRVGVLDAGRLLQVGTPADIFRRPAERRVAELVGVDNLLPAVVSASPAEGRGAVVTVGGVTLETDSRTGGTGETGRSLLACIHADAVFLTRPGAEPPAGMNRLPGRVVRVSPLGMVTRVSVDVGFPLVAVVTRGTAEELALAPGAEVVASLRPSSVHLMPGEG